MHHYFVTIRRLLGHSCRLSFTSPGTMCCRPTLISIFKPVANFSFLLTVGRFIPQHMLLSFPAASLSPPKREKLNKEKMSIGSMKSRVETWIREQTARTGIPWPPPLPQPPPQWRWPPWKGREDRREQERLLRGEYERQRRRLADLSRAVKADSLADLQEILCSMVLSECVYKVFSFVQLKPIGSLEIVDVRTPLLS